MNITGILWAGMYQGYPYVVAAHAALVTPTYPPGMSGPAALVWRNTTRHHYVDGSPSTIVADVNCPHGASVTKAAGRLYGIGDDVVRYCAAGAARDWTTASDAGFLPVSLQQDTSSDPAAVGTFENSLVVAFADGSQIWDVAVDPAANSLRKRMDGVGTKHPASMASFYRDLVFASPFGVRSMSVQENVDRIDETDVGVPVDDLVVAAQTVHEVAGTAPVIGVWIQQLGQYWLIYQAGSASRVFAYSFSRSSKLAAWSEYTFPISITGACSVGGKVYLRTASSLYELDAAQYTDAGAAIEVDVQMAFQDAKLPGVSKMFSGADFVFSGSALISYLYDPSDTSKETIAQTVTGDSRSGANVPVEVTSAAIAPRFRHSANEAFTLDLVTLYYYSLAAAAG